MKKTSVFVMLIAFLAFACSKEDETPLSELENVQFEALQTDELIEVPQALLDSDDDYAQYAASWVQMANSFRSGYSGFFIVPQGATKTTTPITPSNARIAAGNRYLVYTWSYSGFSYAYQIHATTDSYVLEILLKFGDEPWQMLLYAKKAKEGKKGEMKFYDIFGTGDLVMTYAWDTIGDLFKLSLSNTEGEKVIIEVSESTGAGKLEYYLENVISYQVTWTAQGSGTWTSYSGGIQQSQGNWN